MEKEKWASEDEMAGWHHRCNEHELGQTPRDGEEQGSLVCYSPWGCKELDIKKKKRVGHDWATEQQQELDKTTKV